MDELLAAMYKVAVQLVPILGVAVLCFLIALIRHCIALIKELTETAKKAGTTLEGVDKSIDKLQAPLDTAARVCGTVDQIQQTQQTELAIVNALTENGLDGCLAELDDDLIRVACPKSLEGTDNASLIMKIVSSLMDGQQIPEVTFQ